MTKRMAFAAIIGVALALVAPDPAAAGRDRVVVTCLQYGTQSTQVDVNATFEIRATGLRPSTAAQVCISRSFCQVSDVDAAGSFSQARNLSPAGSYTVSVYQARNSSLSGWRLVGSTEIQVR